VLDLFALLLRGYRLRAGLNQDELAEKADISVRALRNLESGKVVRPHPRTAQRLAEALSLAGPDLARFLEAGERPPAPTTAAPLPRQLPPEPPGFAGRGAELRTLNEMVGSASRTKPTVVVISGAAGVGKTALAVHWTHGLLDRYPDGQLYANLRGFDPVARPVPPADVVGAFLHALGEPAAALPPGLDAQTALLRSLLAGRRMVLLLDNARDAAQVRPLLPGAGGCLVVVTSRDTLTGLVATAGAQVLTVGVLSSSGARRVLASRLGRGRVDVDPAATDEIVDRCARLPLAVVIVAARAAAGIPLAAIAAELRAGRRLDALSAGDPEADVRSAIDWSYRALQPAAARLFRLLGLHTGVDLTVQLAASAAGLPVPETRAALNELTATHLLTAEHGRFSGHDLLRAYAGELATAEDRAVRAAAVRRMADHYLHMVSAATALLSPYRDRSDLIPAGPDVATVPFADVGAARAWLAAEQMAPAGMVELAARYGLDTHAWQLARELTTFLDRRGAFEEVRRLGEAGLAAAQRSGHRLGTAHSWRNIGRAYAGLRRFEPARAALTEAATAYREAGDPIDQGRATLDLANVYGRAGHAAEAAERAEAALATFRATGHRAGEAAARNALGWYHTESGDHRAAIAMCESALDIFTELGDVHGQALTWDSLGLAHHHLGRHARAVECYRTAVEMHGESGSEHYAADSQVHLGDVYAAAGDPESARAVWRDALAMLRRLGAPGASAVRERLARLGW
jgi:tetratricopeptide (TPR) repeat protein/transcriptional regulator with XRE-family HTH domain